MASFATVTVTSPLNSTTSRIEALNFSFSFRTARLFSAMISNPFVGFLCTTVDFRRSGCFRNVAFAKADGGSERVTLTHNLVLQLHQTEQQRLGARRAAGDVDVDRQSLINALHNAVGIKDSAGAGTGSMAITHFGSGICSYTVLITG